MNLHNQLSNNLEELGLNRMKEQMDTYLNLVADGKKTMLEALYELSEMEMKFRMDVL